MSRQEEIERLIEIQMLLAGLSPEALDKVKEMIEHQEFFLARAREEQIASSAL